MANNKSAKKRIEINKRNYLKNRFYKNSLKTLTKNFFQYLNRYEISRTDENLKELENIFHSIHCLIDKGTSKNIFHKNTAARKKAKLHKYFNKQTF
uniref:Ribosomal protein S20 n=1 Tax=Climaconeis cf. scalaris TaxID=2846828 RepID=A0A8F8X886_9STRA|nr:ribosomal protein S20 [Climaconeis cf. scalaris]